MKLLGRYPKKVASQYKDLLFSDGMEVAIEGTANNNPFGQLDSTFDSVLVPEESYERAVAIIKEYEIKNEKQLKGDAKEANKIMLYVLLAIILAYVLMNIFLKR